jgi:hypothetical protein
MGIEPWLLSHLACMPVAMPTDLSMKFNDMFTDISLPVSGSSPQTIGSLRNSIAKQELHLIDTS